MVVVIVVMVVVVMLLMMMEMLMVLVFNPRSSMIKQSISIFKTYIPAMTIPSNLLVMHAGLHYPVNMVICLLFVFLKMVN